MTMEPVATNGPAPEQRKNRIQVSNTKKPLFFYVNLAKIEIVLGKTEKFDALMSAKGPEKGSNNTPEENQ